MRPTFMGFEIAKRAAMISQKGLDITGHNLSNLSTPGYSRQRVDVYAVATNTSSSRYGYNRTWLAGQGADAGGISQIRDKFLDKRFREEYGSVGYYDRTTEILQDVEGVLNELGINPDDDKAQTALGNALTQITNALSSMGDKEGDSPTHATVLYNAYKSMAQLLNQYDKKLGDVADQAKYQLKIDADTVNSYLQKISELNENIAKDLFVTKATDGGYHGPNELLDERNLLLDELASYGDMLVTNNEDGTVTVKLNGQEVVGTKKQGNKFVYYHDQLNFSDSYENGTVSLSWQSTGKDMELYGAKGSLAASLNMINGRGPNANLENEVPVKGIRYYQEKLDALANKLAQVSNSAIPMYKCELDEDGFPDPSRPILDEDGKYQMVEDGSTRSLLEAKGGGPITAANIVVSEAWTNDVDYVIYQVGSTDTKPLNKLMKDLTDTSYTFRAPGELSDGLFTGTFSEFTNGFLGELATEISYNSNRLSATTEISLDMQTRRDEVSGVSQDEETVNLMTYSRSFQAAGRLMTALDEALDVIINKMGLVGR